MRVLAVGSMYPPHDLGGGYEITWRSSVGQLRSAGHEVRVLTTDYESHGAVGRDDQDVHRELRWYWRDHAWPRFGRRAVAALERHNADVLDGQLDSFRPDVVCWWAMGGMSLSLIERVRAAGLPAVGVVGDLWMDYGPRVDRSRPRVDLSGAATWLFNSDWTRRRSIAAAGPLARTEVVHPGIDAELFAPAQPRADWSWRLLYLGRLDERKGVHLAIAALALLPAQATLRLQGSGDHDYVESLRSRAAALSVTFASGPRDELPAVYADADAVLFPVQWGEPWGLVPLEAMNVGRPVVASGTGGSGEYLRGGENCLLYEPIESAAALAAAVRRLADDAALRSRLVAGGGATAARFHDGDFERRIEAALLEASAA